MGSIKSDLNGVHLLKHMLSINVAMIPAKFVYVLYGAILALHIPFLNIFFRSVGLSTSEAGFISGIRYAASSLAGPLWGIIADISGRRKLVLVILCVGAAFPIFTMPWVARAIVNTELNVTCNQWNNTAYNGNINLECKLEKDAAQSTLFYSLLVITVFGSMFIIPLPGYIDSIVINVIKTRHTKASYGAQRIFGSLGFCAANFLGGVAADNYNYPGMSHYTAVFYMYLPLLLILIPSGCYIAQQSKWDDKKDADENAKKAKVKLTWENSITRRVLILFSEFDVFFFMTTVFISGLGNTLFLNFSLLLMKDVMNASKTKMTLIVVVGSLSEILIFPFTAKLIKLLRGTSSAMTLGIFSYFVRFLAMSYATEFWMMIVLQSLHGIGFALAWSAMMEHTHKISPKEISVTVFGILSGIFFSFSALIGNMVGGKIYDAYGGRNVFKAVAVLCGVWTILMIMYYGGKHFKNKSKGQDHKIKYQISRDDTEAKVEQVNTEIGIVNPTLDVV